MLTPEFINDKPDGKTVYRDKSPDWSKILLYPNRIVLSQDLNKNISMKILKNKQWSVSYSRNDKDESVSKHFLVLTFKTNFLNSQTNIRLSNYLNVNIHN